MSVLRRHSVGSMMAGLVLAATAGGPASAADASPELAAQCTAKGNGYIWLDALRTCIKPGGYLWAEGYYNTYTDYPADDDTVYGIGTVAVTLNTTTETGFGGPLTGNLDVRFQYRSAEPWSSGPAEVQVVPWTIYAEWAGFTVGYRDSFFDFYANADVQGTDPATVGDDVNLPLAAYTLTLKEGWSATLSVEQGNYRGGGIDAMDGHSGAAFGQQSDMPDFVFALGQTADWGQFQFSGALHRVAVNGTVGLAGTSDPSVWGYALQAGVMFNLPMIAEGDTLYLQTAYVDGAISYLGLVNPSGDFAPPDAYVSMTGEFSKVSGWNVTAQYLHNWTPSLNSAVFGGYARFDIHDAVARTTYGGSGGENFNVGVNLAWSPTSEVTLLAQYSYNYYGAEDYIKSASGLPEESQDAHELLLMAQYNF